MSIEAGSSLVLALIAIGTIIFYGGMIVQEIKDLKLMVRGFPEMDKRLMRVEAALKFKTK